MNWYWLAIPIGFLIDLVLGDPERIPHPVIFIGKLISFLYNKLGNFYSGNGSTCKNDDVAGRATDAKNSAARERISGAIIWMVVILMSALVPLGILLICGRISFWLRLVVESIMCWQILATKGLRDAAMNVYNELKHGVYRGCASRDRDG
ncbi:MAG: cobalamin biosynthesis protein [Firmicutes bacterium]|nr:cobalamin biosynthesis protein [Bacillota bacterium]